jgi:hypothetical protein
MTLQRIAWYFINLTPCLELHMIYGYPTVKVQLITVTLNTYITFFVWNQRTVLWNWMTDNRKYSISLPFIILCSSLSLSLSSKGRLAELSFQMPGESETASPCALADILHIAVSAAWQWGCTALPPSVRFLPSTHGRSVCIGIVCLKNVWFCPELCLAVRLLTFNEPHTQSSKQLELRRPASIFVLPVAC